MSTENVLFKITVKLENRTEELLFHGYDQPEVICLEFGKKNNLSEDEIQKLIEGISSCIEDIAENKSNTPIELLNEGEETSRISPMMQTTRISPHISKEELTTGKNHAKKSRKCAKLVNPSVKLLENISSKHSRYKLLMNFASKKEICSFHPEINKQYIIYRSLKLAANRKWDQNQ